MVSEEQNVEVTKGDIVRIHSKLDAITSDVNGLKVDVMAIKVEMKLRSIAVESWIHPIKDLIFDFVKIGIVAVVTWVLVKQ